MLCYLFIPWTHELYIAACLRIRMLRPEVGGMAMGVEAIGFHPCGVGLLSVKIVPPGNVFALSVALQAHA